MYFSNCRDDYYDDPENLSEQFSPAVEFFETQYWLISLVALAPSCLLLVGPESASRLPIYAEKPLAHEGMRRMIGFRFYLEFILHILSYFPG